MLAFKLGTLLIKQITKPVAGELKRVAAQPGFFRTVCHRYGMYHIISCNTMSYAVLYYILTVT